MKSLQQSTPASACTRPRAARAALAALAIACVAGCAVGPRFIAPPPPVNAAYANAPLRPTAATPGVVGGASQRFAIDAAIGGRWWTRFGSPALDRLIARAIGHNPDLGAARAALEAAHDEELAARGAYAPSVSAGFAANRAHQSALLAPVPNYPVVPNEFQYDLYTPGVDVSYVPDVFGLNRRTVEVAGEATQAARFEVIATYETLVANVAVAAIEEAALRGEVRATRKLVVSDRSITRILKLRYRQGYASRIDLAAQQAQAATTAASLPPLEKALAQQRDLLAALLGDPPNRRRDRIDLAKLHLPERLPVSLPSRLVEQRPDVRQAQANLHAASAAVGIAIAERFPNLTLSANVGSTALAISDLFSGGTGFWGIGASLTAPLFEGGALRAHEKAARAAYREAAEQYRSTVLTAFQNVADTLAALDQDAAGLRAAATAERATQRSFELTRHQRTAGYAGDVTLFGAEQTYLQARIGLIQAQANRFADTVALFQALGGGWWRSADFAGERR